jgi:hypothetical protein
MDEQILCIIKSKLGLYAALIVAAYLDAEKYFDAAIKAGNVKIARFIHIRQPVEITAEHFQIHKNPMETLDFLNGILDFKENLVYTIHISTFPLLKWIFKRFPKTDFRETHISYGLLQKFHVKKWILKNMPEVFIDYNIIPLCRDNPKEIKQILKYYLKTGCKNLIGKCFFDCMMNSHVPFTIFRWVFDKFKNIIFLNDETKTQILIICARKNML